jgi:hypothetical protein
VGHRGRSRATTGLNCAGWQDTVKHMSAGSWGLMERLWNEPQSELGF